MISVARRILDSMFLQQNTRLIHTVFCPLAEVTIIINVQPRLPVSAALEKEFYKKQWRHVQALANHFWTHWSHEYLPSLCHMNCFWHYVTTVQIINAIQLISWRERSVKTEEPNNSKQQRLWYKLQKYWKLVIMIIKQVTWFLPFLRSS